MNKFKIKEYLDNGIYFAYNCLAKLMFLSDSKSRSIVKKNITFKGRHAGQRCFILGTGPSLNDLTEAQVKQLGSEVVFGLNSLHKSQIGRTLRPSYYALVDNNFWETLQHTYAEVVSEYKDSPPVFITDPRAKGVVEALHKECEAIYLYAKKYPIHEVSFELDRDIYGLMNVVSVCIASAMYMGFKEIYLLGCDYSAFCSYGHGHCYDDEEEMGSVSYNLAFYLKYYHITTEFHYLIAKLAKKHGIQVVNLTDVSLLDAYPRLPVNTVLKSEST